MSLKSHWRNYLGMLDENFVSTGDKNMRKEETVVFEPGDVVLFQKDENSFKNQIGIILKCKENGNYCLYTLPPMNTTVYEDIKPAWISSLDKVDVIRNQIIAKYEEEISELQSQIRKPTQEEKDADKAKQYEDLKQQIINTAKNLVNYKDSEDFENKLKAIAEMKKDIFSIELECVSDIRKENGRIKWKIRDKIYERDSLLRSINEERIKKVIDLYN